MIILMFYNVFIFFISFLFFFFFFSSRRRHTRFDCDWSSDVCSSDLQARSPVVFYGRAGLGKGSVQQLEREHLGQQERRHLGHELSAGSVAGSAQFRSEERRVGKECRSRWWPDDEKKKGDRYWCEV